MRILLHSGGPLGPAGRERLAQFLAPLPRAAFVTAANLHDEAAYFERVRAALAPPPPEGAGLELVHLRWNDAPLATLAAAAALFMGGGNTYALLKRLRRSGLLGAIRERVAAGCRTWAPAPAPTWRGRTSSPPTTGTWWRSTPSTRSASSPFNINPHYKEVDPAMAAGSETRDDRIREYHAVNGNPVVGLEEGSWLESRMAGHDERLRTREGLSTRPGARLARGRLAPRVVVGAAGAGGVDDGRVRDYLP